MEEVKLGNIAELKMLNCVRVSLIRRTSPLASGGPSHRVFILFYA